MANSTANSSSSTTHLWRTAITDAGRFYFEHSRYPDKTQASATTRHGSDLG